MTTAQATEPRVWSRWDAAAMWFYGLLGVAFVVWTLVGATRRIIEVVGGAAGGAGGTVPVLGEFAGTPAEAPIGPDGAAVTVELDRAVLLPTELPIASTVALVLEQVVIALSVTLAVGCLLVLTWSILHGRLFSRRNTALVATATGAALVGFAGAPFFANMGANGAFAWISDRTFDNVLLSVDPVLWFGVAFVGSIVTTAFSVGARLQRDTEGLV